MLTLSLKITQAEGTLGDACLAVWWGLLWDWEWVCHLRSALGHYIDSPTSTWPHAVHAGSKSSVEMISAVTTGRVLLCVCGRGHDSVVHYRLKKLYVYVWLCVRVHQHTHALDSPHSEMWPTHQRLFHLLNLQSSLCFPLCGGAFQIKWIRLPLVPLWKTVIQCSVGKRELIKNKRTAPLQLTRHNVWLVEMKQHETLSVLFGWPEFFVPGNLCVCWACKYEHGRSWIVSLDKKALLFRLSRQIFFPSRGTLTANHSFLGEFLLIFTNLIIPPWISHIFS